MRQSIGLSNADSSDGITNTTSPCVMLCFLPVADRPSFLVYFQQWYQKGFLVKPKKGHSNNTQGQWWEPASLPVIIHLFTELMTVAGGQELGASSHVMSPTHAKGLWGQAGDKKCGLYRKEKKKKHTKQPLLLHHPTINFCWWSFDKHFDKWQKQEATLSNIMIKVTFGDSVFIYVNHVLFCFFYNI